MLAEGAGEITYERLSAVGQRNVKATIFDAVREILRTLNLEHARKAIWDLDESPEDIIHWLDENLPLEYRRAPDLAKGYDALSKADLYLGKIRRRQYYRFWAYANDMMTAGVALAKHESYHGWVKYQFPSWILHMSRTKQIRQLQKGIAKKIGLYCHTSQNVVAQDILPYFREIFKVDHEFAVNMSIALDFSKEELGWLLEDKATGNKVKYLQTEIRKAIESGSAGSTSAKNKAPEIFPSMDLSKSQETSEPVSEPEPEPTEEKSKNEKKSDDEYEDNDAKKDEKKVQKNLFDY
jgi:replication factor C large subunit